jgi:4-amino-4-deoxy-L-arabinose transferase-like glycosyltransferase
VRKRYIAALILIVALGLRVAVVQHYSYTPLNDGLSYMQLASEIAHSGDYSSSDRGAGGSRGPTAYFPPGYPYFLAAVDVVDGHKSATGPSVKPARIAQALLGTAVVGLVGLVALELFGQTVALIALGLAAVFPPLVELSSVLVAETLLTFFELLAVWSVLRARRSDHAWRWAVAAGLATGLAALTHQNGILLLIPLVVGLWGLRSRRAVPASTSGASFRARAATPAILVAAALVTIAPWMIRNQVVMHQFVPISDESGITLAGTYNPTSAADHRIPWGWRYYKAISADRGLYRGAHTLSEPALSSRLESRVLDYVGDHPLSPIEVAFHNTLRLFELEGSFPWRASAGSIGVNTGLARIGVLTFWLVCALAVGGLFTRAARGAPRWIWGVPVLFALSIVFVNVETPRFREPIDPFLILLAACAVRAAVPRAVAALRGAPVGRRLESAAPTTGAELVEMI